MKAMAEKSAGREIIFNLRAQTGDKTFAGSVKSLSRLLDGVAAFCLAAIMVVVVANIVLRVLFKSPILGTIDYVGFLAALAIGLAVAYCAMQNAHIAVDFIVERFPPKFQIIVDLSMSTIAIVFWGMMAWHMYNYGQSLAASGVVSPTTQTPFYPFVYLVAFGLFVLCLVLLVRIIDNLKRMAVGK